LIAATDRVQRQEKGIGQMGDGSPAGMKIKPG
jgi:hypothetical protein